MKLLLIIIATLIAGLFVGHEITNDPKMMTVVVPWGGESKGYTLPVVLVGLYLIAAFAILYLLFSYLFSIFRAPKKIKQWNKQRNAKNAQSDTMRGYARLIEGDWDGSEKDLTKRLKHNETPLLNYLGVAYAAQQRGNFVKRDEYLALAEKSDPANRMAVDLTRARLLTQAGDFTEAKALLEMMHEKAPANKTVLRLMSDVYRQTEDWNALTHILPKVEKCKALGQDEVCSLEVLARESKMTNALDGDTGMSTLAQYKALPRKRKTQRDMAALYAKKLIQEGELGQAEAIVRKAIKQNWTSELAALYGKTRKSNLRSQISVASSWIADHGNDPNVYLTLARLNMAHKQTEKAQEYYQKAIDLGAGDEAYYELGGFHEHDGDASAALGYYKKGLAATVALGAGKGVSTIAAPALENAAQMDSVVTPGLSEQSVVAAPTAVKTVEAKADEAEGKAIELIEAEPVEKAS